VSRREQVFWGWGESGAGPSLPAHARAGLLRHALGIDGEVTSRPVALADVRLREPAIDAAVRRRLEAVVGEESVRDDREARVLRCRGKSYLDLLAQRAGDCEDAPDLVVSPGDAEQVQAALEVCADAGVAVVPFGGGTSVVGGLEPERGAFDALISLDLGRLDRLTTVDERSLTAVFEPGIRLPEADLALAARGLTLGHLPQSYEWASVGGCVATRSAGQASTGFGRIEDNVVAVRCATPAGALATLDAPASAAGPSLRELVVGSEGTLGVITSVALRARPLAPARRYEGWFFHTFAEGADALRLLEQRGVAPDLARLSDEAETRFGVALSKVPAWQARAGRALLSARGYAGGCLMIVGWEGSAESVARRRAPAARVLRQAGGLYVGRRPGEVWRRSRFDGPHVRDDLLDVGVLVETLETATRWSNLDRVYRAVGRALEEALRGTPPLVLCHVSHLYPTGASLYFTILARQDPADPVAQWRTAKAAACDAIAAEGATISHHHAIGRDHAPWLQREVGDLGLDVLRAVKQRCDPAGIMNPGKIFGG
jgi:alkyldihydroxyacetonephosphate synthase